MFRSFQYSGHPMSVRLRRIRFQRKKTQCLRHRMSQLKSYSPLRTQCLDFRYPSRLRRHSTPSKKRQYLGYRKSRFNGLFRCQFQSSPLSHEIAAVFRLLSWRFHWNILYRRLNERTGISYSIWVVNRNLFSCCPDISRLVYGAVYNSMLAWG